MKGKKRFALAMVCWACGLILISCGRNHAASEDRLYVGVAFYNQSDSYISELMNCLKEQFARMGEGDMKVTMAMRDAAGSQRTQDDQVKEMIDAGCNVLCVNLVDRTDPSTIIDMAKEKDVPIIFFNREPVSEDMMRWDRLYYVGADAKQSGVMQGELAADAIRENKRIDRNHDGKIQYVVLEGEPGHQDAIIRTENAVDTLKNQGIELEKLNCGIANWNRAQAQNRMMQMIGQYQNKIELVLANNDDMALGAIDAYKKLNFTESARPVFFGIDGTDVGLRAVVDLELAGTVYNDKEGQAQAMAKLAEGLALNRDMKGLKFKNKKYVFLPYKKITSDNVGGFIGKNGGRN